MAIKQLLAYLNEGYEWIVIDLAPSLSVIVRRCVSGNTVKWRADRAEYPRNGPDPADAGIFRVGKRRVAVEYGGGVCERRSEY